MFLFIWVILPLKVISGTVYYKTIKIFKKIKQRKIYIELRNCIRQMMNKISQNLQVYSSYFVTKFSNTPSAHSVCEPFTDSAPLWILWKSWEQYEMKTSWLNCKEHSFHVHYDKCRHCEINRVLIMAKTQIIKIYNHKN